MASSSSAKYRTLTAEEAKELGSGVNTKTTLDELSGEQRGALLEFHDLVASDFKTRIQRLR